MNIFETVRTALESLASNKLRTILTMLGVIIGVASVVSLLSIGAGVSSGITSRVSSLGSNLLTISTDGRNAAARLTNNDVAALADPLSVPGAERVVPEVRGNSRAAACHVPRPESINAIPKSPARPPTCSPSAISP